MAFHAIAPQSGAYTSSSCKKPCYDVFINYRGKDVKHKLASTIYNMFDLKGVQVFRDEEELELGDSIPHVIEEAIRSASVHIAIFSPSYAESPWCLEELSLMLQINATIIPVFYGVQPSDVRYVTTGIYARAFRQHERKRRYNPQKIKEWKDSLSRVSYLSGCIVDGDNCDEGQLSREIVETALRKMKRVEDFQWLKTRLSMLKVTLQYADENPLLQQWIEDVRDTFWDAEDILDEYSLHKDIAAVGGRKMKQIKERMNSIMETANELKLIREVASSGTVACTVQRGGKWKKSSIMEYGSLPVAVDIKAQNIIERLDDPALQVLAVVGMGGISKTFLIQHVYNKVKHMFQNSIWLSISQTYSLEQLQRDLAFKLNLKDLANSKVSCTMGAEIIHHRLKETKCLIVLDDVWRATEEEDLVRSLGIPFGVNNRCKVIVTSRNKEVFSHLHPFIYQMALLSAEDSWKLFCAHAFSYSHENSPPAELQMVAREIEKECGRLPLAIKTVASCLNRATTCREWELKLHQLKGVWGIDSHDPIMQILKLSYDWLPPFLKPCFVYLSSFPEDEDIDCEYLVKLWIAEGFIPQTEDQVDMAWDYLRQLANLCLVDVWEPEPLFSTDINKSCRIHDVLLELAVQLSKENKSAFSAGEASKKSGCRRILLAKKDIDDKAIAESNLCCPDVVRTLSLSHNLGLKNIPLHMLSNARVLRVLDLSHTGISTLPESIGDLKLLRILNLCDTKLQEMPQCVRKLRSLSFLDVSRCRDLCPLPLWIGELVSLQHLNISCGLDRSPIPKGISKLVSLCTLRSLGGLILSVSDDEYLRLEDIQHMTCLQELRIQLLNDTEIRSLAEGILGRLGKMRLFELVCVLQRPTPIPLSKTIKAMKDLQTLHLYGNFAVPGWIRGFENLRVLKLGFGCDNSDLYPALQTMGNLTVLRLLTDENCRKFPNVKRGGFPNLRAFSISDFKALEELPEVEDGGMASLEMLFVTDCWMVTNVPRGFQRLKRLREFRFVCSGTLEYRSRLKEEWSTVKANQHFTLLIRL